MRLHLASSVRRSVVFTMTLPDDPPLFVLYDEAGGVRCLSPEVPPDDDGWRPLLMLVTHDELDDELPEAA